MDLFTISWLHEIKKNPHLFCRNWSRGYLFVWFVSMLKSFSARCFTSMAPLHYTMVIIPEVHPVLSSSATASRNPSEADLYCWNLSWRAHLSPCFQIWPWLFKAPVACLSTEMVCEQVGHKTVSPFRATIRNSNSQTLPSYPHSLRLLLHGLQAAPLLTPS